MKKNKILVILILIVLNIECISQSNSLGIRFGYGISSIDKLFSFDNLSKNKINIGMSYKRSFKGRYIYQSNLYYAKKGLISTFLGYNVDYMVNSNNLYLKPIINLDFHLLGGLYTGYLLKAKMIHGKSKESQRLLISNDNAYDLFNKFDFGFNIGLGYNLKLFENFELSIDVLYSRGMLKVFENNNTSSRNKNNNLFLLSSFYYRL